MILSVRPGSTAARLGFQPGDVIQQVGREKIETVTELEAVLKERQRVWLVVVKRGNQTHAAAAGGLSSDGSGVMSRRRTAGDVCSRSGRMRV